MATCSSCYVCVSIERARSHHMCLKTDGKITQNSLAETSVYISFYARFSGFSRVSVICRVHSTVLISRQFFFCPENCIHSADSCGGKKNPHVIPVLWHRAHREQLFVFYFLCPCTTHKEELISLHMV